MMQTVAKVYGAGEGVPSYIVQTTNCRAVFIAPCAVYEVGTAVLVWPTSLEEGLISILPDPDGKEGTAHASNATFFDHRFIPSIKKRN